MPLRLTPDVRDAAVDAVIALADAGAGPATISIYTGTQPASATSAPTGTLLVSFTLPKPAYTSAVNGVATLDADPDITSNAVADGTAGWGRLADSDGNTIYDGECSTTTGAFVLNALNITNGQTITLTTGTLSVPSGE